jgi:hypothetical protein
VNTCFSIEFFLSRRLYLLGVSIMIKKKASGANILSRRLCLKKEIAGIVQQCN